MNMIAGQCSSQWRMSFSILIRCTSQCCTHAHTTNSHSQHHTFEVDELLRVTKVEPSGQACQLCIQMGWIVVAVNDVVVMSKEEMLTAIAQCAKEDNPREVSILFDVFTDETKITDEYSNTSLRTDTSLPAGIYPHLPYF